MTTINVTDWDPQRVQGYLEAIRGDHPSVEVSLIVHDDGQQQQMTMALTDDEPSDFVARRCETCRSITVARVLPLDGLLGPKTITATNAPARNGTNAD